MAIVTRLARLVRADVNAVLDRIEEPDILLRQAIRDMEEALQEDEQRAVVLGAERLRRLNRLGEEQQAVADLAEKLALCLDAGKDQLARDLIRRRLESERLVRLFGEQIAGLDNDLAALKARITGNRSRYELVRAEAALMASELDDSSADPLVSGSRIQISDTDVEVALLREKQRRAS